MQLDKTNHKIECLVWFGFTLLLVFGLYPLLSGAKTLVHDNLYWNFPVFHYTATSLMQGQLPLWDPFSHGGEPFYPHLVQFRLLEPLSIGVILVGKFFTHNTTILFNWSKVLQLYVMALGSYVALRGFTPFLFARLCLIPVLLFSSFFLGSFHQDGILSQFLWVPWIFFFLCQIFFKQKVSWKNFLILGVLIGLNWQSYHFVGTWTFLFLFLVASLLFHLSIWKALLKVPKIFSKISTCIILSLLMIAPNLCLIFESDRFVFPLRMFPANFKELLNSQTGILPREADPSHISIGIKMPYEMIPYSGAMVKPWELIQTLSPNANPNIHSLTNPHTWGTASEAYIYLGALVWAFVLLGFFIGRSKEKRLMLFLTLSFGLLMMGPPGGLHRILFYLFPPLWFIRHTTLLTLFFQFGCLYFFVLGITAFIEGKVKFTFTVAQTIVSLLFGLVITVFGVFATKLEYPVFKFPETNFVFVLFAILAFAGLRIKQVTGRTGLFVGLLLAQIALVFILSTTKIQSGLHLSFFLILPLSLLILSGPRKPILLACYLLLIGDLGFGFYSAKRLYDWQDPLSRLLETPMEPKEMTLAPRKAYPSSSDYFSGHQSPRYLSLLRQERFAFSGIILFGGDRIQNHPPTLEQARLAPRWNTYLLSKSYFQLINSPIPDRLLESIFAMNAPLVQFQNEGASFQYKPLSIERNRLVLEVNSTGSGTLIYADAPDRFWKAYLNHRPTELRIANSYQKAVTIPPGISHVEFRYEPYPFLLSLALFFLVPLATGIGILLHFIVTHLTLRRIKVNETGLIPA